MKQIEGQAVMQTNLEEEEAVDFEKKDNVITMEDIIGNDDN